MPATKKALLAVVDALDALHDAISGLPALYYDSYFLHNTKTRNAKARKAVRAIATPKGK